MSEFSSGFSSSPLVSVIIPVYNNEKSIARCIDSLLKQTYCSFELIVIDNNSTDKTMSICKQYGGSDSRIKIESETMQGVSFARNHGLEKMRGDYVTFVDGDDWCNPCYLETLVSDAITYNTDISGVAFDRGELHDEDKGEVAILDSSPLLDFTTQLHFNAAVCSKLYSRSVIEGIRFPVHLTIAEDKVFGFRAFEKASRASFRNWKGYHYTVNPYSATHEDISDDHFRAADALKDECLRYIHGKVGILSEDDTCRLICLYIDEYINLIRYYATSSIDARGCNKERIEPYYRELMSIDMSRYKEFLGTKRVGNIKVMRLGRDTYSFLLRLLNVLRGRS
ncbi:glycosyltransferase family A protein [Adlercreutzia sp. ZJ154]|uniref:glycosyltransferase family 2 protein n=1 Tax=Adlercreutzia sp. ZJ154 TaxID=2709790 RepID=UPI0013E9D967|nr:glycosyltransferase family A protein [Adlercreutzia sp. ZJ154]